MVLRSTSVLSGNHHAQLCFRFPPNVKSSSAALWVLRFSAWLEKTTVTVSREIIDNKKGGDNGTSCIFLSYHLKGGCGQAGLS